MPPRGNVSRSGGHGPSSCARGHSTAPNPLSQTWERGLTAYVDYSFPSTLKSYSELWMSTLRRE